MVNIILELHPKKLNAGQDKIPLENHHFQTKDIQEDMWL